MARKENAIDLTAGLTFGSSKDGQEKEAGAPAQKQPVPETKAQEPAAQQKAPAEEEKEPATAVNKSLADIYEGKLQQAPEARTVRIQAVVTPSISKKLDELASKGKIKSRNDLINFLLEGYLKTFE